MNLDIQTVAALLLLTLATSHFAFGQEVTSWGPWADGEGGKR